MTALASAAQHEFQSGKLVNISEDERLVTGTTLRWAVFVVQVNDIVYTARGPRMRRRSGDPGHGLILGDSVMVAIEKDDLIIRQPDGKELKAKITRRERVQQGSKLSIRDRHGIIGKGCHSSTKNYFDRSVAAGSRG